MRQTTFAEEESERYRKPTRREKFLAEMDQIVPWKRLLMAVKPCYPNGQGGRPTIGLERMLRIYFLQHWFDLSDPGAEEALYEMRSMSIFSALAFALASARLSTLRLFMREARPRIRKRSVIQR